MPPLAEIDGLEILVIVDNELDPISTFSNPAMTVSGNMLDVAMRGPALHDRGDAVRELRLDNVCCGAHGLSLMITAIKGETRHTVLFDTGPEERIWEQNAKRVQAQIGDVEVVQLSHWHRDHSGGMLRAIRMINEAKSQQGGSSSRLVTVDLHPNRPIYRGIMGLKPISLEPDPTFDEIEAAGGKVSKNADAHSILDDMFIVSGEIPRVTSYETGIRRGIRFNGEAWEPDELIKDERFLMCNLKGRGLVMFTGCSHAGAVNASKHALELAGGAVPLHAVVGGYHLTGPNEAQIAETVADFKTLDPAVLLAGHCSGWRVKFEIEREMPGRLAPSFVGCKYTF